MESAEITRIAGGLVELLERLGHKLDEIPTVAGAMQKHARIKSREQKRLTRFEPGRGMCLN